MKYASWLIVALAVIPLRGTSQSVEGFPTDDLLGESGWTTWEQTRNDTGFRQQPLGLEMIFYEQQDPGEIASPRRFLSPLDLRGANATGNHGIRPIPFDELVFNEDVQNCFYCIFDEAGFGSRDFESAAWISQTDGVYQCIHTGWTHRANGKTMWLGGPRPRGYLAIVHTHPTRSNRNRSVHEPSENDRETARNLKPRPVPIYTVTPRGIWKYDPSVGPKGTTTQIVGLGWHKEAAKRSKGRCARIMQ